MSKMEWSTKEELFLKNQETVASPRGTPTWRGGGRDEALDEGGNRWERELTVAVWFHPWTYELCKPWPVHTLGAELMLRSFYLVLFISCLYLYASLCILCIHEQYILTDLTLNVLCLLDFSRLHAQVSCLLAAVGFGGFFWFVWFFLSWMKKMCFDFFNLQRLKLCIIKAKCE